MTKATVIIDIRGMPEVIFAVRVEMANLLRARAKTELLESTRHALIRIAADFEVGGTKSIVEKIDKGQAK